jgi:hypothetical protein
MNILGAYCSGACILLSALNAVAQDDPAARLNDATVALIADCPSGQTLSTGVIVAQAHGIVTVLTVSHTASCPNIHVRFYDGEVEPAFGVSHIQSSGPPERYDIGIVHASAVHTHAVARISATSYDRGQHLTVVGHGDGQLYAHADAKVIDPNPITLILACQNCRRGDSGAGVFNDSGDLVGIVYGEIPLNVRVTTPQHDAHTIIMTCWLSNTLERIKTFLAAQR